MQWLVGGSDSSGKGNEKGKEVLLSEAAGKSYQEAVNSEEQLITQKESSWKGASGGHCPREPPSWQAWKGRAPQAELSADSCSHRPRRPPQGHFPGPKLEKCVWRPWISCLGNSEHLASHLVWVIWLLFYIFHFTLGIKGWSQSPTKAGSVEEKPASEQVLESQG